MTSKSIYSIYKITNTSNSKVYIGYSVNVHKRWLTHKRDATKPNTTKPLYLAIQKYGIDNFSIDIIYQSLDKDHCKNIMEPFFINEYNSIANGHFSFGYNVTKGGDGGPGVTSEIATILNKERVAKGTHVFQSDDFKTMMAERHKIEGHPNKNRKHSAESGKAKSDWQKLKALKGEHYLQSEKSKEERRIRMKIMVNRSNLAELRTLILTKGHRPIKGLHSWGDDKINNLINELNQTVTNN